MYYHTIIIVDNDKDFRKRVMFKSDAKTTRGVLKALAKEIVDRYHTDVFDVTDSILSRKRKNDWPDRQLRLSAADKYFVWETAHNLLLG